MCGLFTPLHIFFIVSTLIQRDRPVERRLNRTNKQNFTPRGTSWLTDRHTQNYTVKSTTPCRAALLGTYWHLTTTTLYPKQNRENNNESDACPSLTTFCLCSAAIAAQSGCWSILLPQLNSCSQIYISNLATIKIPELLVNSLSLYSSTSHLWFASSGSHGMWCGCLINPSKYVWGELWLCLTWAQCLCVSQEPEDHWGPINPSNMWWASSSNKKHSDGCTQENHWINSSHMKDWRTTNIPVSPLVKLNSLKVETFEFKSEAILILNQPLELDSFECSAEPTHFSWHNKLTPSLYWMRLGIFYILYCTPMKRAKQETHWSRLLRPLSSSQLQAHSYLVKKNLLKQVTNTE